MDADLDLHRPARLPACEADLPAWAVYADHLMSLGEPRGFAMALELALPARPGHEELARWHALAAPLCRRGTATAETWCLGHARALDLESSGFRTAQGPSPGALAQARDRIAAPTGRRLEELAFAYTPRQDLEHWQRIFRALPPTCTRVAVDLSKRTGVAQLAELLALLPPQIREIRPSGLLGSHGEVTWRLIDDRFDVLDLSRLRLDWMTSMTIRDTLAQTERITVRVGTLRREQLDSPRCVLGGPRDAALVAPAKHRAVAFARWPLAMLQRRDGLIPARTQWARPLVETHEVPRGELELAPTATSESLVCRGDRWTIAGQSDLRVDGVPVGAGQVVEVPDGGRITLQGLETVLLARDANARARALMA